MPERASVAKGTVLGIAAQGWQLVTSFLLLHFASNILGTEGFGIWRVTLSVLNYFELLVYSGVVQVASKRIAGDPDDGPLIERASYVAQIAFGLGLFVILQIAAGPIAVILREPELETLIRIAALDIPLIALFMLASNLRLGRHHFVRQTVGMLSYSTAKFVAIGGFIWFGFSVEGALVGNALASVVGFVVMFEPWIREHVPVKKVLDEAKGMGWQGVPFVAQNLISGVSSDSPLWFVQAMRGASASGLFSSAEGLASITSFLFAGLNRVLFPSVARADAANDERLVARYVMQGVRLALLVTVLGVGVIWATGEQALTFVYSAAFAAAAPTFTILMVAAIGHNVRATCTDVMLARGQRRQALSIVSVSTVIEVGLLAAVTPVFGLTGAAWVAAAAASAAAFAGCWVLRSLVGWRVVWTLVRSATSALVTGGVLLLMNPHGVWLFPAYVAAVLIYGGVLALLGEFDADDRAALRAAVRRTPPTSEPPIPPV